MHVKCADQTYRKSHRRTADVGRATPSGHGLTQGRLNRGKAAREKKELGVKNERHPRMRATCKHERKRQLVD